MRELPKATDPDFVTKMMLMEEQDISRRLIIPHLSDRRLIETYRQLQTEDALGHDTFYLKLLHLEFSARIFERLVKTELKKATV